MLDVETFTVYFFINFQQLKFFPSLARYSFLLQSLVNLFITIFIQVYTNSMLFSFTQFHYIVYCFRTLFKI